MVVIIHVPRGIFGSESLPRQSAAAPSSARMSEVIVNGRLVGNWSVDLGGLVGSLIMVDL